MTRRTNLLSEDYVGTVAGGGFGYARYRFSNEEVARKHRLESTYNVRDFIPSLMDIYSSPCLQSNRIRAEDHSVIGSILLAVLTPAILWKRANTVNRTCQMHYSSRSAH